MDIKRQLTSLLCLAGTLAFADESLLYDGRMNPACVWDWKGKPIEVVTDLGGEREVGGVRILTPRSWINCSVKKASFYGVTGEGASQALAPLVLHVDFRPANTYKELYATWKPVKCAKVKMVIEDTYDFKDNYYCFYTHEATKHIQAVFETPPYTNFSGPKPTVQIAELSYFGAETPSDLPLPNKDGTIAYPESRLLRDWAFQSCAVSNVSHCASVEPDTTKPDPMGESIGDRFLVSDFTTQVSRLTSEAAAWRAKRREMRREFLAKFRDDVPAFVYVKHLVMGNSIFHATDDMTDASFLEWKSVPDYRGGSQLVLARIEADGSVSQEVLVDEPVGVIRDPVVSFDAKKILFAKRRALEADDYHLWTYDLDTRELRQLTFAETVKKESIPGQTNDFKVICSDIEPCWLPDGSIMFQSTRCAHSVDCWPLPVSNLFRCDADGKNIRRVGFDQIQTFYPQLMNDGRVSFTRWEYNDRSASGLQQLYAMNPDGTRQMGLFANNSEFPFSLIHAKSVPGSQKLMAISSGHHVAQKGRVAELDPTGPDDYECCTYDPAKAVWAIQTNTATMMFPGNRKMDIAWTPWDNECGPAVTNMPGMHYLAGAAMNGAPGRQPVRMPHHYHYNVFDMHSQFGPQWAYPCPVDTNRFLVSYMPEGCRYYRGPYSSRFGVYAMTADGRRELLAFDWGNHCMQPQVLKRRTPPNRLVRKLDYRKGFGKFYVQDVYEGLPMKGVRRGTVKKLRVVALEYRPVHNGWNWQYGRHSTQGKIGTPIAVGNGAYDVKHVFGEADVEEDGSCTFLVPARAPVYFQLVDADGCVVQTMRSWVTPMPGEANACIGCHERPRDASAPTPTAAFLKPPQKLKPCVEGMERHPLLERLEKEGPLASLANWMGVNRWREPSVGERGEGFSFPRYIQPIFDRSCVSCHGEGSPIDLRGVPGDLPPSDDKSMRRYTKSYLAFTEKGRCTDNVNFAHGMGFAPFKPPYSFGAARSKWYLMLKDGHPDRSGKPRVKLSDAELRTIALWIDLCIPFAGSYTEANAWDAWHLQRYLYTYDKRIAFYWLELNEIRRELGMDEAPMEGFVPNVSEPRKQRRWDE